MKFLSTQVADKDRQSASDYPWNVTTGLGLLSLASSTIVLGLTADFVYELNGDAVPIPWQFGLTLAAASVAIIEQVSAFMRQVWFTYSAGLNTMIHATVAIFWLLTLIVMSYWLQPMVLSQVCSIDLWRSEMGVMVCQMYKALFAFIVISFFTSLALVAIDSMVMSNHKTLSQYAKVDKDLKAPTVMDEKRTMITALRPRDDYEPSHSRAPSLAPSLDDNTAYERESLHPKHSGEA